MNRLPGRLGVLEYHDIVHAGAEDASGFAGPSAASYKVDAERFAAHLAALDGQLVARLASDGSGELSPSSVLLTFDDGGVDAIRVAAPMLEERGMRGLFFTTVGRIGQPGFLGPPDLRELRQRGHAIGSHSMTHPTRFSTLSPEDMRREWHESRCILEDILGCEVRMGSVPGGYHSLAVAREAARAGYAWLFTSEPSPRVSVVQGCAVVGRFTLRRKSSAAAARALATGQGTARRRAAAVWTTKKVLKRVAGPLYLRVRRLAFRDA